MGLSAAVVAAGAATLAGWKQGVRYLHSYLRILSSCSATADNGSAGSLSLLAAVA